MPVPVGAALSALSVVDGDVLSAGIGNEGRDGWTAVGATGMGIYLGAAGAGAGGNA